LCSPLFLRLISDHFQFSLGVFFFIDASTYSHSKLNASLFHITFVDWIPLICSSLGMLVINSIEKTRLSADSFSYSGSGVAWKARLVLFLGFALMAGGLAGSVTVMVLKYLVRDESEGEGASFMTLWLGIANVVANALVMLRYVSAFDNRMVVLTGVLARLFFGFRRIWRMIIPTTWPFDFEDDRKLRALHQNED
jgi:Uncharacterised protein family (UPF0220)